MSKVIDDFRGEYWFLSNYFPSRIEHKGIIYPTMEHFFQALKTTDMEERKRIAALPTPGDAKRAGRRVKLRNGWDAFSYDVMGMGLRLKFKDKEFAAALLATGNAELVEGNTWHDNRYGDCRCSKCSAIPGQNRLGKLLMQIREELKKENGN